MPSLLLAVVAVVILAVLWLMPGGSGQLGLVVACLLPVVLIVWGVALFQRRLRGRSRE